MATAHVPDSSLRVGESTNPDEGIVDRDQLWARLPALKAAYGAGLPFAHVVIDGIVREDVAKKAFESFPRPGSGEWIHYNHVNERKSGRSSVDSFPEIQRRIVEALSGSFFVDFLSQLTGVPGLFADPDLEGGGLHQSQSGGFLSVHTDFSSHAGNPTWARRVNVLIFFNPDWKDEYGGDLEFWDSDMRRSVTRISPLLNRCVIFETNGRTFHGHPTPLTCGADTTRKSLALYYFTEEPNRIAAHATKYRPRPQDSLMQRAMIYADNAVLAVYDSLKRRFGFSDRFASRILKRLFR